MGLFDTIEIIGKCRNCGNEIFSWQTKSLEHMLFQYKVDDFVNEKVVGFIDGEFYAYSACKSQKNDGSPCEEWNDARVIVKNRKIIALEVLPSASDIPKPPDNAESFLMAQVEPMKELWDNEADDHWDLL